MERPRPYRLTAVSPVREAIPSNQPSQQQEANKHRQVALSDSTRPVGVQAHSGRRWTEHLMLPSYALINVSLDHRLIACVNQCTPKIAPDTKKKVRFKSLPPRTTPNTQRNFPSPRLPPTMFWRPQAARTPESACASDLQHQPRAALQHRLAP